MNCRNYIITTINKNYHGIKVLQLKPSDGCAWSVELYINDISKTSVNDIITSIKNSHNIKYPDQDMILWVDKDKLLSPIYSIYRKKNIAELVFSGVLEPYDGGEFPWQ